MPISKEIYLDSNASAPLHSKVLELLKSFSNVVGNPSSLHRRGRNSEQMLEQARIQIAKAIGAPRSDQIIFTSSGTEANQTVIRSAVDKRWFTTGAEHSSVLAMRQWAESQGARVEVMPVDSSGLTNGVSVSQALLPHSFFSFQAVNSETGVVHPIKSLIAVAKEKNVTTHIDAVGALGKIPIDVQGWGADFVTLSGHKIGAPQGIGAIWAQNPKRLKPLILGNQEQGIRGGTQNLLGAICFGIAASAIDVETFQEHTGKLRDMVESFLQNRIRDFRIVARGADRVTNTLSVVFGGIPSNVLVQALDMQGICVSTGSACSSGFRKPSHVLLAMGYSMKEAESSLRVSFSTSNTVEDVKLFTSALESTLDRIRKTSVAQELNFHG